LKEERAMSIIDVLNKGVEFTNSDETACEMLVDFKNHKVGMKINEEDVTLVIKDSVVSLYPGINEDCDAVMALSTADTCGAIDDSYDLMEIKDKGEILKGDPKDPAIAVHFMATFPFFDAMVRLYQDDNEFQKMVDDIKASC
jgi:hypothetical protein